MEKLCSVVSVGGSLMMEAGYRQYGSVYRHLRNDL